MSAAVTSSPEKKPSEASVDQDSIDAFNLLAQGKRNMLCGEMVQAINQLQEACRLLAKKFGETADECGEAYYTYGKALLEMARMETGVLGNALQGMSEEEEEEESESSEGKDEEKMSEKEKEEISEKIIEAMEERDEEIKAREEAAKKKEKTEGEETKEAEDSKEAEKVQTNGAEDAKVNGEAQKKGEEAPMETDEPEKEKKEESAVESEDIGEEESQDEGEKSQEEGEKSQEEGETSQEEGEKSQEEGEKSQEEGETSQDEGEKKEEDDVSNLQLAWEMLELCKIIFLRHQDKKEMKVKLAETHLRLGEVGLETEQYDQAVGDFQECLKIQRECLESCDRALAETCYQLGLAYTFKTEYDDAVKFYKEAASIIEAKIAKLEKVVEEADKSDKGKDLASFDDPVVLAQKEIGELKDILPDIMGKIEDVTDEQKNADALKKMVKDDLAAQIGGSANSTSQGFGEASSSDAKPVSDISHLVRKKRKTDEEDKEDDSKKAKTEADGSSDAQVTNGHSNGDATSANGTSGEIKTKTVEDVQKAAAAEASS